MILVLPLIVVFLFILYYYLTWPYDYWKKQGMEYAKTIVPGFGNTLPMLLFRENLNFISDRIYRNCSPNASMIGMFHLRTPTLIVRDPELVQKVLVTKFAAFENNLVYLDEHRDEFLSKNPFFAVGETWKNSRKLVISGMSQKKLKLILQFMQRVSVCFDEHFDRINHSEIELRDMCYRLICEIIFQVGFGIKPEGNFDVMINKMFESTWFRAIRQLLNFFLRSSAKVTGISFMPIESQRFFKYLSKNIIENYKMEKERNYGDLLHMIIENFEDVNDVNENMISMEPKNTR
ncbi:probable cytochrome P450 28d2 isoform X2 [Phymastichus coffea]|uniref:probable cytochrome P450 28d2 isoform X2 n=1 Tax=Phymastichus coffea TaxID=108790 RepID=UPI00273A9567|nr:probable cytochrome P450 28d2 isoform X2 [Phymastichus coffea]